MFYIYNYLSISLFFLFFFLNNPPPPKSSPFPHPAPLPTNRDPLGHQEEGPLQGARWGPRRALLGQRGIVEALHQRQPPRRVEPHKPLAVRGPGGRIECLEAAHITLAILPRIGLLQHGVDERRHAAILCAW